MSLPARVKRRLKKDLSLSSKLLAKRAFVGTVRAAVRLAARVYNFADRTLELATTHGLDLRRAWDVRIKPQPPSVQLYGAHDFLFVMDALNGKKRDASAQATNNDAVAEVRASIIIPVFNKIEYTFQCLRSLLREVDLSETEIIIVNNASQDETARVLAYFKNVVRVVENETNLGFVDACNRGAATARGRFLIFLNNDTVVMPGWLKHLIQTVERDESVGAVGSMLIYPDGRLQEAGAIVWRDGEAFHYGWGKSPDDSRYSFAREVDYCSGASLLIRREIFEQLGGFDRRYAPAYYEDADLCFGVRSLGYKVVYQPASQLIHFEGTTAGTEIGAGFKRYQNVNREKFFEKWRDTLERDQLTNDSSNVLRASNRKRGPHVIIFDDRVPTPDRDAGSARMMFILRSLARWSRPVFVSLGKNNSPGYERLLWNEGIETASATEYTRLLRERKFSAAIISRPDIAGAMLPKLRRADPDLRVVFDMVDTYFIRHEREHNITGDARRAEEAREFRKLETGVARGSDLIWCASSEDKKVMEHEAPGVPIEVIPTIHEPHEERGLAFTERNGLLFVGNFAHRPNSDGVQYFMREVYPLVRDALPGVKFDVVGDYAPPEITAYDSEDVRVHGYVPDIAPLFRHCRVFVAPVRFGAGVKGKIGESLAYGVPVVTTSVGAEGMNLTHGEEALIADTPREFADCVVRLYREQTLWQKLSDEGYEHVKKTFAPQVVGEIIDGSLRELLATHNAARQQNSD